MTQRARVMIAGVGGASLGTELLKCLLKADRYEVAGCDISPTAYGLHQDGFARTYHIDRAAYLDEVIRVCHDFAAAWLIPGGEQPMVLLGAAAERLADAGITLLANDPDVVATCSDKHLTFETLAAIGITIPRTVALDRPADLDRVGLPCIVKPATGSGGSASVFFSPTAGEAMLYAEFIRRNGSVPIAQEYIDIREGEFTVGVLSLADRQVAGSIALRRDLTPKLSVAYRGREGVISSGYSQGHIGLYPDICRQAEAIARQLCSRGPMNIQGRLRGGVLLPFEINPRFSASTYLRAMAGFNEVDIALQHRISGRVPPRAPIRPGWYLRSLTEQFVPEECAAP